ncbi:MAG: 2-oxo acid dehydrogenase subunit E2 [Gammaproteobacteria bacterium]|nr:2-oxo acid dehydrogenase subunit E2 [Gammaproteobacteria bacterium]
MKQEQIINVPDIGGVSGVDVIEVLVSIGDKIEIDTPLVTLESDKASMEIPSPQAGVVTALSVKVGDKVAEGSPILTLTTDGAATSSKQEDAPVVAPSVATTDAPPAPSKPPAVEVAPPSGHDGLYAGPAVRRLARELGVDLTKLSGTGRKARVMREDVIAFFKKQSQLGAGAMAVSPVPVIDFSQFGPIETKPLNKIKRLTAQHVYRSWATIPHVTQFGDVDITDLEAFRREEMARVEQQQGVKLTILAFIVKALTSALAQFPQFNASLDPTGDSLIYKQYFHIGIAVETPNGLVVPVIKNADQLSVGEIAKEMGRLSTLAREKGVPPADMKGGTFTVSSLGGIGGTAFTPIVNAPEVAILGVSKASIKPIYQEGAFVPRLILPLSLSYDHRVIDGAEGARFINCVSMLLNDVGRILL